MTRTLAAILAASVMLAVGCSDDGDPPTEHCDEHADHASCQVGTPSGATCPNNSALTYTNFGKDFFAEYCNRCHSSKVTGAARMLAPIDHNFDTLDEIDLLKDHIDQKAAAGPSVTNMSMPPSDPKPSVEDRKKLGEWIACDVPE